MNQREARELALQTGDSSRAAVGRAIVDDPEYTTGVVVRRAGHDLLDQAVKRIDSGGGFAAAEDTRVMDIQGGDVGPGAATVVFMLDAHGPLWLRSTGGVFTAAGLNAGLFVGGDHEFIRFQCLALPCAGVEIEDATGLHGELRIAWKDPTAVIPGPNSIPMEPAPDRAVGNGGDQAGLTHVTGDVRRVPTGKRKVVSGGQFTGQSFNLHDQFWGEKSGGDPDETALPGPSFVLRRTACATY